MATQHAFLGVGDDVDTVLGWFRDLGQAMAEHDRPDAVVLHFTAFGALAGSGDEIDQSQSPLVWIVKPRLIRRALWTMGQVIFPATPLKERFPGLHVVNRAFGRWLAEHAPVYSWRQPDDSAWSYYLEGQIRNRDVELFALPRAFAALQRGQYFVHPDDNEVVLDRVCRSLRLRGVDVEVGG